MYDPVSPASESELQIFYVENCDRRVVVFKSVANSFLRRNLSNVAYALKRKTYVDHFLCRKSLAPPMSPAF